MTSYERALRLQQEHGRDFYRAPHFNLTRQSFKEGDCTRKEYMAERRADQRARKGSAR